jgi:hypothetical protein
MTSEENCAAESTGAFKVIFFWGGPCCRPSIFAIRARGFGKRWKGMMNQAPGMRKKSSQRMTF